ncbi:hemoglobin/transferrin/lactoferrin receptor protein [Bosea sp. BE271]|uniref:TonB-dependent hemoglobin/transferrin/lactoferrin family receptor n=1 Tax=Bosea TaxID=85413 RepID=UPI0028641087|nr:MULTISPECIES: TonB-dependent hemoglobin/transferrin/lactoferrin family receptor [Bosea]MDR6830729.1 hemoglobin/transferrin/lactoferrin receptor protein [Bosea robiniae]MDR6897610.1 hemoglobin/transferrin/lactoferrin receptor protein [Bosea sp. BE109]MDR7141007.1 hemoglobin/transferrin/lactoferrin receptor protein [Bosea sp. BE168]MDR7177473.1 hemoglobin/transferrin/lactoferrin receptor protein [Bosea sp. BE271]
MGTYSGTLREGVALGTLMVVLLASPAIAQQQGRTRIAPAAQASEGPVVLDQINVQGEGVPGGALLNGPTTTRTTRAELDRQQVQSLTDLANRVEAGITFNRQNNSLNIRGLDGARVLTTVDGIRQPFLIDTRVNRGGTAAFDFDSLSTLDLLRGGSGGATLGNGALGGALAVRTLDPEDLIKAGRSYGALAKTGYDSTDRAWFGSAAVAARMGNTSVLLQGGFRDGHEIDNKGNIKTVGVTRTAPSPSDFNQYNLLGKIYHTIDGVHRFGLTGELFKRAERTRTLTGTSVSLTGNFRPGNYVTGEDTERNRISLSYDYKQPGGFFDEAHATLYWQRLVRNDIVHAYRFTSIVGPHIRDNENEENAYGFNGYVVKNFQTGMLSHRVTLGTELRASSLKQYSSGLDNCPARPASGRFTGAFTTCNNLHTNQADQPDIDGKLFGLYLHDEIGLLDNRLRITPGVRFDWYEEKPQQTPAYSMGGSQPVGLPPSSSDSAWSPRLRLEYDILKNAPWVKDVTVFAQWAKTFRAPTANELYGRFGGPGTYLREGNPTLRPEKGNGVDVGVRFGDKQVGGSIAYFFTNYDNFIETYQVAPAGGLYPQGGIFGYRNIPKAEIQGVEINGQYAFAQNWLVRGSFAYTRGRNKTDDVFLNSIPPVQGIVAVAYGTDRWGAEVSAKLAAARDDVAATTGTNAGFKAPGYAVFNASAWWRPAPQIADLELQVGVYNIFDRKYFDAVNVPTGALTQARDYYSEPGRTVKATLKYQF